MIKRKGLNYMKFNVCMIDNDKWESHFNMRLSGQTIKEEHIAEEVSIRQLIDLHSFIGCVLKMRENK